VILPNGTFGVPTHFASYGEPRGLLYHTGPFKLSYPFIAHSYGQYRVWVGGSFGSTLTAKIDGRQIGQQRNQSEWPGNFLNFGAAQLRPGRHVLVIKHNGRDWWPGSAAHQSFGLGPFVIAQGTDSSSAIRHVTVVQPKDAHSLCGRSLDWIEALRPR
jgi:hypothetical protein